MDSLLATFAFLFGLIFGSFLNVCIYRLPRSLSVVSPRSACPKCHTPIAAYDNIPVLSWLLLGRKCRHCKTPITPRYMIVELICGVLFLACYLTFGPRIPGNLLVNDVALKAVLLPATLQFLKYVVLCFLLLGLIFTDAETQLLPDAMTLPGLLIGLAFSLFVPLHDPVTGLFFYYLPIHLPPAYADPLFSLLTAAMGAIVGGGFIWSVGAIWKLVRGYEGMGFGDVKLMAMVGAFLGAAIALSVIFLAALLGSVLGLATVAVVYVKRRQRYVKKLGAEPGSSRARRAAFVAYRYLPMPFGVSLGAMALLAIFFMRPIFHWYMAIL